jgi:hypothetical protein
MLDMQEDLKNDICDWLNRGPLDPSHLVEVIKSLSPAELAEIEDDLDFAQFTGVQSDRIQALIARLAAPLLTKAA